MKKLEKEVREILTEAYSDERSREIRLFGALIGDIVGSRFEFNNIKTKEFEFITDKCFPTDDSYMTLAVAEALTLCHKVGVLFELDIYVEDRMQDWGKVYPDAGYGGGFRKWLRSENPKPYNSFGNGAAMRVSACAWAAKDLETAIELSKRVTEITHNHSEGLKGAEATTVCIFMARKGKSMREIRDYVDKHYYPMNFTLDEIRPTYRFNETCQETVPQAIMAFLESTSFEDAIRNAISIGGDSDTLGAITGSIAEAYYDREAIPISDMTIAAAVQHIDERMFEIMYNFAEIVDSITLADLTPPTEDDIKRWNAEAEAEEQEADEDDDEDTEPAEAESDDDEKWGICKIDLHLHTNMSDGTDSPLELLAKVEAEGLDVFSVTDHDDIRANNIILSAIKEKGCSARFITGCEISSIFEGRNLHLLCYGFDPEAESVKELIADIKRTALKVPAERVTEAITKAGGLVSFAHPIEVEKEYRIDYKEIAKMAKKLKVLGLSAIEVFHSSHIDDNVREYRGIANKLGLFMSGGSDYHGGNKSVRIGQICTEKDKWFWHRCTLSDMTIVNKITSIKEPQPELQKIQKHFHALIRSRAARLVKTMKLPIITQYDFLPERQTRYFPVPGMYGGFSYRLENRDGKAVLITESWCRICGGSGQRHEVTAEGFTLVGEGFV